MMYTTHETTKQHFITFYQLSLSPQTYPSSYMSLLILQQHPLTSLDLFPAIYSLHMKYSLYPMCTSPSELTNKVSGIRDQFAHTFF